jgi:hypothetical protein
MTSIWRNVALLMLVQAFAACGAGLVREAARTKTGGAVAATRTPVSREATRSEASAVPNENKKEEMAVAESMTLEVYRRGGRYYVTAGMRGSGTEWFELSEIIQVEPMVESIAAAFRRLEPLISTALAEAHGAERHSVDDKNWKRMGAKNPTQFMRSTSYCAVDRIPEHFEIWYMHHDTTVNMFWSIDAEPNARLPRDASYEDIARAVLEVFAKNPPPPGDKPAAPKRPRKSAVR